MTGEGELITRAVSGDAGALNRLASRHRPYSLRIATQVLGDPEAAEDVAQEVLLRLKRSLEGFRGDSELSTWVYRVTLNACRDHIRRGRRKREVPMPDADHEALRSEEDPGAAVDTQRLRAEIRAAVDRLPEDQRHAVRLRFLTQLSYAEISSITGVPQGTVASRIYRALERLGRDLGSRQLEVLP